MSVVSTVILSTALSEREGWEQVQRWLAEEAEHAPWGAMLVLRDRERAIYEALQLARAHVSGRRSQEVREKCHDGLSRLDGGNKRAQARIGIGAYNAFSLVQDAFIERVRTAEWFMPGCVVLVIYPEHGAPFVERLEGEAD